MALSRSYNRLTLLVSALALVAASGCTDEKLVFRDRFNPPPDAVNGFLGYFDAATKQTTCGNCHVRHQADWELHAHSDAYNTLASNPGQQAFCYTCHTVSDKGNIVPAPAGWDLKPDPAYHDVQCENCHGPGATHVEAPDASAPPLAHIGVLDTDSAASCAACHAGVHHPFVEEWSQTGHARSLEESPGVFVADIPGCDACHEGRAVLRAWGVTSNYAERDSVGSEHYKGVTCAVCHDPHGTANPASLRWPLDDPSIDNNLCMKCHSRRAEPSFTSSRGPHAPQGQVLEGTAGWIPPGFAVPEGPATHGNPTANPRLCAGCHVLAYTTTDADGNVFNPTGHRFLPIPCVDANGAPLPAAQQNCAFTAVARRLTGCATSTCHGNAVSQVETAIASIRSTLSTLIDPVWTDVDGDGGLTPGVDTGLFPDAILSGKIPATEFSVTDNQTTVAEGVLFNLRLFGEGRYPNGDRSMGIHNPVQSVPLIASSIQELQDTYGPLPVPPVLQRKLDDVLRTVPRTGIAPQRLSSR